jgi:hypothetical protein
VHQPDPDFVTWCSERKAETQLLMVLRSHPGITAAQWWAQTNRSDWMFWLLEKTMYLITPEQKSRLEEKTKPIWARFEQECKTVDKATDLLLAPMIQARQVRLVAPLQELVDGPDELREDLTRHYRKAASEAWKLYENASEDTLMDTKIRKAKLRAPCRQFESDTLRSIVGNPFEGGLV